MGEGEICEGQPCIKASAYVFDLGPRCKSQLWSTWWEFKNLWQLLNIKVSFSSLYTFINNTFIIFVEFRSIFLIAVVSGRGPPLECWAEIGTRERLTAARRATNTARIIGIVPPPGGHLMPSDPWEILTVSSHGLITYKDTKTKCRLYWRLIEFIDRRYSQSCWFFRPSFGYFCPSNLLSSSPPLVNGGRKGQMQKDLTASGKKSAN